jgi:excisionase family DNA binding protein
MDTWLSINQAADAAGVSRRTIYLWIGKGKLEVVRTAGGSIRIAPASLFRTEPLPVPAPTTSAA